MGAGGAINGSPPHARGRRPRTSRTRPWTSVHPRTRGDDDDAAEAMIRAVTVHPRTRGDDASSRSVIPSIFGSPPHARGRRGARPRRERGGLVHPRTRGDDEAGERARPGGRRFTPARAGTTESPRRCERCAAVHPRTRGDDTYGPEVYGDRYGSPPHARGRRLARSVRRAQSLVHPRTRGDDVACSTSARTWGAWFIPARAGTTKPESVLDPAVAGSPPHARGRLRAGGARPHRARFTPARAGTTPGVPGHARLGLRFTPARAGTTPCSKRSSRAKPGSPPHARGRRRHGGHRRSAAAVHPRTRGDDLPTHSVMRVRSGSPPHARGRRVQQGVAVRTLRFTPARAGTTPATRPPAASCPVHPRTRGDDDMNGWGLVPSRGSPPHARGRRACRGTASAPPTVHPRTRGDDVVQFGQSGTGLGSPPHARGRLAARARADLEARFTPARAGTTTSSGEPSSGLPVHPRTRGDDSSRSALATPGLGSPPHARGRRSAFRRQGRCLRFTPARAGTTRPRACSSAEISVHPRTRGDDGNMSGAATSQAGSPPHARGGRRWPAAPQMSRRFTPARAGTTVRHGLGSAVPPVHPRTRGDDAPFASGNERSHGSPPHARGRPGLFARDGVRRRFTPARAGTTCTIGIACAFATVHPRTRGDDCDHTLEAADLFRFTPARAGTTSVRASEASSASVHPRTRGYDAATLHVDVGATGSPPHARGRRIDEPADRPGHRFTPARAGTT